MINIKSDVKTTFDSNLFIFKEIEFDLHCKYIGMVNISTNMPSGFGRVLCDTVFLDGQFLNYTYHGMQRRIGSLGLLSVRNFKNNKLNGK